MWSCFKTYEEYLAAKERDPAAARKAYFDSLVPMENPSVTFDRYLEKAREIGRRVVEESYAA